MRRLNQLEYRNTMRDLFGHPVNRWTSYGSPNKTDWLEVDFGQEKVIKKVVLHIYDDHGGVQTPLSYSVQYLKGNEWKEVGNIQKSPVELIGSSENIGTFAPVTASKLRVVFVHKGKARSGLTELEVW
ncbi:discoidin domain-containing protein [Rubripirellula sp.]|nr:discoidin domain-containing protein [Rubripirellula sp.]